MSRNVDDLLTVHLNITLLNDQHGPGHHGMARPQVADGETASNMEGNCE